MRCMRISRIMVVVDYYCFGFVFFVFLFDNDVWLKERRNEFGNFGIVCVLKEWDNREVYLFV